MKKLVGQKYPCASAQGIRPCPEASSSFFFSSSSCSFLFFFFSSTCTYIIFLLRKCVTFLFAHTQFFVLFNEDIIVHLYQLYFSILSFFFSTKQISFLSFHISILLIKHKQEKTKFFYPSTFLFSLIFYHLQVGRYCISTGISVSKHPHFVLI